MTQSFNFMATGIGSVPYLDVENTCRWILEILPDIPFWPQFVRRSFLEDMTNQPTQGLPLIGIDPKKGSAFLREISDKELLSFYENFLSEDIDYFAVDEEHAAGIFSMLELINNLNHIPYIKGQLIGPVTFGGSLRDKNGKSALYNSEVMDALVKGIAVKARWIAERMSLSGKKTIVFLDEPYLSGFGSAFTPIAREEVIKYIREVLDYLRAKTDTLIGIHCCGNTDWSMIIETGLDIVSFDAYDYLDYFLLYKEDIIDFLERDGVIAWGIVPTTSFTGSENVEFLKGRLQKGIDKLHEWGIKKDRIARQSLITPACGLGVLKEEQATKILELLSSLSSNLKIL